MEARDFGAELLRLVNVHLAEKALKVARGSIVDTTIINAAPTLHTSYSTENSD